MLQLLLSKLRKFKRKSYLNGLIKKGLKIGSNSHIVDECFLDSAHCHLIEIKNNCTIAPKVAFIAHDASTNKLLKFSRAGKITVESDCFVGYGAIILPGVTIGAKSIVAAGSMVTKDVPENSVVAGNPARIISSTDAFLDNLRLELEQSGGKIYNNQEINDSHFSNGNKKVFIR